MAFIDVFSNFVRDNTSSGSWYKPQLKQRCEEFLNDSNINGDGNSACPETINAGMLINATTPTLSVYVTEDHINSSVEITLYINGSDVDNVLNSEIPSDIPALITISMESPYEQSGVLPVLSRVVFCGGDSRIRYVRVGENESGSPTRIEFSYHDTIYFYMATTDDNEANGELEFELSYDSTDDVYAYTGPMPEMPELTEYPETVTAGMYRNSAMHSIYLFATVDENTGDMAGLHIYGADVDSALGFPANDDNRDELPMLLTMHLITNGTLDPSSISFIIYFSPSLRIDYKPIHFDSFVQQISIRYQQNILLDTGNGDTYTLAYDSANDVYVYGDAIIEDDGGEDSGGEGSGPKK